MEDGSIEVTRQPNRGRWTAVTPAILVLVALSYGGYLLWHYWDQKGSGVHSSTAESVIIPIEGMSCSACVARVKRTLKGLEGVKEVQVSLEKREAEIQYEPETTSPEKLRSSIDELGYTAVTPRVKEKSP